MSEEANYEKRPAKLEELLSIFKNDITLSIQTLVEERFSEFEKNSKTSFDALAKSNQSSIAELLKSTKSNFSELEESNKSNFSELVESAKFNFSELKENNGSSFAQLEKNLKEINESNFSELRESNESLLNQINKKYDDLSQTIQDNKTQIDNQLSFLMYSGGGMGNIPTPQRRVAPGISCAEPTTARRPERLYGR